MFRDLLSSRLIQGGIVFFVLVVGGSLLYSWHVRRATGRNLAPSGYNYGWFNGGPAQLFKKNKPYVHIIEDGSEGYGADWQLSDTEWERYIALGAIKDKHTAKSLQLSREVVELAEVWYQELHEKTWGKQPAAAVHVTYNRPVTPEDRKRERELALAKLASIRPPDRSRYVNYDIVYQLITEIEAEINR